MAAFRVVFVNPASSRGRLISRKGSGLSRPNFDLYGLDCGRARCAWFLEMQFERLAQIRECLFFRFTLTGHVYLKALRDVPFFFTPDGCRKLAFHTPHCFTMAAYSCRAGADPILALIRVHSVTRPLTALESRNVKST